MASLDLARNTFGMTWSSNGLTHEGDHLISVRILSPSPGATFQSTPRPPDSSAINLDERYQHDYQHQP